MMLMPGVASSIVRFSIRAGMWIEVITIMLIPGLIAFIVNFPMRTGMSRFIFCGNRSTNCPTYSSADNRTITTTDLIANCRASSTTDAATDCRIQGGTIRVRFNNHQCKY
jgi:hypothetical protein